MEQHRLDVVALSWSGGFFEGEGTVQIGGRHYGAKPQIGLVITNTDLEALLRFRVGVFGFGDVRGPRLPQGLGKKPSYVWTCTRFREVVAVTAALWSFLSERRKQQLQELFKYAVRDGISGNRGKTWPTVRFSPVKQWGTRG